MARKPTTPGSEGGTRGRPGKTAAKRGAAKKKPGKGQSASGAQKAPPVSPRARATKASGKRSSAQQSGALESGVSENALPSLAPPDPSGLKEGKLYYRIGEVSQITGVKPYVLRYWESEFRLMAPQKSRSKQRLYRRKDIDTILHIKQLLYEERYTIAGARRRLRELGADRVREEGRLGRRVEPQPGNDAATEFGSPPLESILAELRGIRALLSSDL